MSVSFNLWPALQCKNPNATIIPITSANQYVTLQCELLDMLGQESPLTWEMGIGELVIHDDKIAMMVALKWS